MRSNYCILHAQQLIFKFYHLRYFKRLFPPRLSNKKKNDINFKIGAIIQQDSYMIGHWLCSVHNHKYICSTKFYFSLSLQFALRSQHWRERNWWCLVCNNRLKSKKICLPPLYGSAAPAYGSCYTHPDSQTLGSLFYFIQCIFHLSKAEAKSQVANNKIS